MILARLLLSAGFGVLAYSVWYVATQTGGFPG